MESHTCGCGAECHGGVCKGTRLHPRNRRRLVCAARWGQRSACGGKGQYGTLGYRISSAHSHNSGQSTYALCRHRVAKSIVIFPELTVHFKHFLSDEARLVIMLQHRKQLVKGNNRNTIYLPEFLPWTASRLSYSSWHAHIPPLQPTFPSQRGLRYLAQAFLQHK